jgi:hypothetical protein
MTTVTGEIARQIERELREGTPNTPKRIATIKRADEVFRRSFNKEAGNMLHPHQVYRVILLPMVLFLLGAVLGAEGQRRVDTREREQIASLLRDTEYERDTLVDLWTECVLGEPIRFPEDTMLWNTAR